MTSHNGQTGYEIKALPLVDGQIAHPLASSLAFFTHLLYSSALLRSFAGSFTCSEAHGTEILDAYLHFGKMGMSVGPSVGLSISLLAHP